MIYYPEDIGQFIEKISSKLQGKLVALDVGSKKIGIAACNMEVKIAVPKSVIKRDLGKLIETIKAENAKGLVVGLSLGLNGQINNTGLEVVKFIENLVKKHPIPILFQDERFTTRLADRMLRETKMKPWQRNQHDDKIAASIILGDFLQKLARSI